MIKRYILGFLVAAALFSTPAFAAQNVANTSQKGSLLDFPLIDIRPADAATTQVEISNDANTGVHIECYYVNDKKGRRDFDFSLTAKGTVTFDVLTHSGDVNPAVFPNDGFFPGDPNVGELICFAVDPGSANQVRFNHLTGTATVVYLNDKTAAQPKQAFKYNAWAFSVRNVLGTPLPADNSPVGTPGRIVLSGTDSPGVYDACPAYLIGTFSPGEDSHGNAGAFLAGVSYIDNDLTISVCNQDLRQDFIPHFTKLQFNVWNAHESSFSGSYQCSDSVLTFPLGTLDQPKFGGMVAPENFDYSTLRTRNARFQVQGIPSTQCFPLKTEATGLLGVLNTSISINSAAFVAREDAEIGNTLQGAGAEAGFVLWDPSIAIIPEATRKR